MLTNSVSDTGGKREEYFTERFFSYLVYTVLTNRVSQKSLFLKGNKWKGAKCVILEMEPNKEKKKKLGLFLKVEGN